MITVAPNQTSASPTIGGLSFPSVGPATTPSDGGDEGYNPVGHGGGEIPRIPQTDAPSNGSGDDGDVTVNYYSQNGTAPNSPSVPTSTSVPDAPNALSSVLGALSGIFTGSSAPTPTPTQQAVAVPIQNGTSDTSASNNNNTGKSVIIVAGVIIALAFGGYYGYSHGWFSTAKKEKKAKSSKVSEE